MKKKGNKKAGAVRGPRAADHGVVNLQAAQRGNVRRGPEAPEHTTIHINEAKDMTSQEVLDATGDAPERQSTKASDVLEQLRVKRAALISAREKYQTARTMRDEDGMAAEGRRIDALLQIIPELEAETATALEAQGQRRAKSWLRKNGTALAPVADKILAQQEVIRAKIKELVKEIEIEAALRAGVVGFYLAEQTLSVRFGLPLDPKAPVVWGPPLEDWATPVLKVTDSMRPSRSGTERLQVSHIASDSPERRRQNAIATATKYARRFRKQLPVEVRSILDEAPAPSEALAANPKDPDDAVIGTRSPDPALATAATEAVALAALGMPGGNVHRG